MNLKDKPLVIDNKTYHYSKIVMLVTNNKSDLYIQFNGHLRHKNIDLSDGGKLQHIYFLNTDEIYEGDWVFKLNPDGKIIGSPCKADNSIVLTQNHNGFIKIISTTNTFLNLPKPSDSFLQVYIDAYNKGEKIEECLVEYIYKFEPISKSNHKLIDGITKLYWLPEGVCSEYTYYKNGEVGYMIEKGRANEYSFKIYILKTTKGEITIKKVKTEYSEQEMFLNMQYYMEYCERNGYVIPQDWLEKHKHF